MKSALTYWIAFLFVTIGTSSAVRSAEDTSPISRQARVVMASVPEKMDTNLRIYSGGKSIDIPKSKRAISPALQITKTGLVSVAKFNQNAPQGEPLIKISVPEKMQQVLIILIPKVDADGAMKLEFKLWDLATFGPGDWLFLNVTNSTIRVTVDGETLEIPADSDGLSKSPSPKDVKSVPISYENQKNVGDQWSPISSSSAVRYPERREICIFTEDAELETINYHALSFIAK